MATGASLFAQSLKNLGIEEIFVLVGDHLNEVLLAIEQHQIKVIDMRHESGVTHAADALARVRRKPAVSLVTGGPGHTNSLTGIATAFLAASPLIAVSGSPAAGMAGRQVFQVVDQVGMTLPVVKWSAEPTAPGQIPYLLGRAYSEATTGRMGPVHLTIPVDVFAGEAQTVLPMPKPVPPPVAAPSQKEVLAALALLRNAERPVVIAGSGVWWGDAGHELSQFVKRTKLPLYTVTMARGVVPDSHPQVMGYADPAINRAVRKVFPQADCVLVLGKRIDYRVALGGPRLFSADAKFIQVDFHAQELGANRGLELAICADVKATLREMVAAVGKETWKPLPWLKMLRKEDAAARAILDEAAKDQQSPVHPAALFAEIREALPKDTLISWDGGDCVHWGRAMLPAEHAGGWLRLGPMGTIGSALPNALSLQMAHPGRPVLMVTGDGSLGFYLAELETLVRYKLPVVIVVGNDGGWGLERELQRELTGGGTVACELKRTSYDVIMKGFGGEGETISRPDQVAPALRRAFASGKPYLLNVEIRGIRSAFTEWQIMGKKK